MEPWHVWVILAIALFVFEIFTPGFVLAALGVGCLASAIISYAGLGLPMQFLAFSIGTLVAFVGIRPFVLRKLHPGDSGYKSNVDALVGRDARVLEAVNPATDAGRVLVAGEDWKAVSETGERIAEGTTVTVVRVDGTKLVVVSDDVLKGD